MKRNILCLLMLCATLGLYAQQQLPNSSFENWNGTVNPQYWCTMHSLYPAYATSDKLTVQDFTQFTDGASSVRINVDSIDILGTSRYVSGYITVSSSLNGAAIGGAFNALPDSIYFDYNYVTNTGFDAATVSYGVYRNGTLVEGLGGVETFIGAQTNGWFTFSEGFNYSQHSSVDSIAITITASNAAAGQLQAGTSLYIDNIRLIYNNPCGLTITATPTNPNCNGGSDGLITVSATGVAGPDAQVYWFGTGTNTTSFLLYPSSSWPYTILGGFAAGTYGVEVDSFTSGCKAYTTVTINDPPVLTGSASSTPTSGGANNGTVTASASGGVFPYTYQWSNSQSGSNLTGMAVGTYRVTITDNTNCSIVETTTVGYPPPTISTDPPSNVNLTSAKLNGTVNPNFTTDTIVFEWGTTGSYGSTNPATPNILTGSSSSGVSVSLFALNPYTTYYYRVRVNTYGTPYYGSQQQFYTGPTGIPETGLADIAIYPNPARHQFTIETNDNNTYALSLFNMVGEKVAGQIISQPVTTIDVSSLANGIYMVNLKKDDLVKSYRVVIMNE